MRSPQQVELPCVVIIWRYLLSGAVLSFVRTDNACPDLSRSSIFFLSSGVVGFWTVVYHRNNAGVVCHYHCLLSSITITRTSSSSNNNDPSSNKNEEHPSLSRRLPKTSACETEELMLSLNEEIRLHFRHASYKDATVASKLLLTTWRQHQHIIM
jgi:hypothetical protein